MRKGEPVKGLEFFDLLYADKEFCDEFGRCLLEAARLESKLTVYLITKGILDKYGKDNLGTLIRLAKKHGELDQILPALKSLKDQRDYLTHNLYALYSSLIEEKLLSRSNLIDSDVDILTDRVSQLREDFQALGNILSKCASPKNV